MTDSYTPDMIDIKIGYCSSFDPGFAHKVMAHTAAEMTTGHAGDFDRAMEKHDREVRAQAQRELIADLLARDICTVRYVINDYPIQAVPKSALLERRNRIARAIETEEPT